MNKVNTMSRTTLKEFKKKAFLNDDVKEEYNLSKLEMSLHAGTHLDFPRHFIPDSKSSENFSVREFILPAHVVSIESATAIEKAELQELKTRPGDAILFKTENSSSGRSVSGIYSKKYVYMEIDAARCCVKKGIKLVGIDYITIEKQGDGTHPVHKTLLENEIMILEGINLKDVPNGRYTLICLPLKLKGAEGSPARAILVK